MKEGETQTKTHVFLITIDDLRADRLQTSGQGLKKDITTNIGNFSKEMAGRRNTVG